MMLARWMLGILIFVASAAAPALAEPLAATPADAAAACAALRSADNAATICAE